MSVDAQGGETQSGHGAARLNPQTQSLFHRSIDRAARSAYQHNNTVQQDGRGEDDSDENAMRVKVLLFGELPAKDVCGVEPVGGATP
jgi:hypothetical protein